LADQGICLAYGPPHARRRLHLRQVTRLDDDGHQTQVITSRWDLPAIEGAHRLFSPWRQENFFKYLREEYALDVLVDYGVEPVGRAAWPPAAGGDGEIPVHFFVFAGVFGRVRGPRLRAWCTGGALSFKK
jgi:hypothetical protein